MMQHLLLFLLLVSFFYSSIAQLPQFEVVDVPISDTTNIVRSGSGWVDNEWVPTSNPTSICGTWTREAGDSVTFKFTGTSVSVIGDIVYPELTQALLDGKTLTPHPEIENIICNEILFSADNLDPTEHTLVVTAIGGGSVMPVLVIQQIRYTAFTASSSTTSTSASMTLSNSAASDLNSQSATLTDLNFLNSRSLTTTVDYQSTIPQATNSQSVSLESSQSGLKTSPSRTSGTEDGTSSASSIIGGSSGSNPEVRVATSNSTGTTAGGVAVGIAGLVLLYLAITQRHEARYYISALAYSLFGWSLFKGRIIVLIPERKIDAVDVTLFLSYNKKITDTPMDNRSNVILVWQVAKIGYSRKSFSVCCPCVKGTGKTMLGFGVVDDNGHVVRSETAASAPTTWNGIEFITSSSPRLEFTNDPEAPIEAVTLGTHEETKNAPIFRPFLWLKNVSTGKYIPDDFNLYIHAFITHGYEVGQYGDNLVGEIRRDMLTKRGIKVSDLGPRSNWYISKTAMGIWKLDIKGCMDEEAKLENDEEIAQE